MAGASSHRRFDRSAGNETTCTWLAIAISALALFPLGFGGVLVLCAIGTAAASIVLMILRPKLTGREIAWAAVLTVLATVSGLVEWSISWRPVDLGIALSQLPLVFLTLCAGWAIARRVGWLDTRIGSTAYVSRGTNAALRAFGFGFILAAPWALGNIANGPFPEDHITHGWQVLAELRPAVAEEAWARVLFARCSTGRSGDMPEPALRSSLRRYSVRCGSRSCMHRSIRW